MIAGLRTLCFLALTALLAACTSTPSSNLGELPRTQQGSLEQLLQQASVSPPEQASELLLAAADLAHQQNDDTQAARILQQVPQESLKPAQQIFANTLSAELAMARNKPKTALKALNHPSFARLSELPVTQQLRSQLIRAKALEASGQTLEAARERVFIAPLLSDSAASSNHEAIWALVATLPAEQLQSTAEADLAGWLALAQASKTAGSPEQQQNAIDTWVAQNPQHPAAKQLPQALAELKQQTAQPLRKIALLLPQEGPLASVAQALRDGFMASY
ncbi:MAG: penicillin-binding protein activator, partial [Pseudomonadaceae bacterium]|nr:penicillin-binding protein activator [Pseudomonadaceae bacterium]